MLLIFQFIQIIGIHLAHHAWWSQRWSYIKCEFTIHALERLRLRLEELSKNYGIEIVGEIQRVIDEFCKAEKIDTKKLNDEESYSRN